MRLFRVLLAGIIVGCGGNPLVGKWMPQFSPEMQAQFEKQGLNPKMELNFDRKNSFSYRIESSGQKVVFEGEYTIIDDYVELVVMRVDGEERPQVKRRAMLSDSDTALTLTEMGVPIKFRKSGS